MKSRCINCGFGKTACFLCWDCWRPTLVGSAVSALLGGLMGRLIALL